MGDRVHLFGIRHHGPGSAASLRQALVDLEPSAVLIEGPVSANGLIPLAGEPGMRPPLALMQYPKGYPDVARFYPLAEFSPEWQALQWAIESKKHVEFIDLPLQVAWVDEHKKAIEALEEGLGEVANDEPAPSQPISNDPLSHLAKIAGFEDGESWWNTLVEQSVQAPAVFDAIHTAMCALREHEEQHGTRTDKEKQKEALREAHMRACIRVAKKTFEGDIAVVCGAWHTPALQDDDGENQDRALLKDTRAADCETHWIPWTDQRLAVSSGYGAGVVSPGWYEFLWRQYEQGKRGTIDAVRWQVKAAGLLRENGIDASTASVIEASRLATTIAAVRGLPTPGLEEMQDASLAALCAGNDVPLRLIESRLVIGNKVGAVDENIPQPPLLADLARLQKKHRLKPEALERELRFDLRSVSGMAKSELLHRLCILQVPWGKIVDAQAGRGTFTERWIISWQPEHAVRLSEVGLYGATVESAAAGFSMARAKELGNATELAELIRLCSLANLPEAAQVAIDRLQVIAATAVEVPVLMALQPPLIDIVRYGTARKMPLDEMKQLALTISVQVVAGYRYSCHQLDDEAADELKKLTRAFDRALTYIDDKSIIKQWQRCLHDVVSDDQAASLLQGLSTRLLYNCDWLSPEDTANTLSRNLSHSVDIIDAANWIDGFIDESGELFLHDDDLFNLVDQWMQSIPADSFIELLPMLRRSFSGFDAVLRRQLMTRITTSVSAKKATASVRQDSSVSDKSFERALPLLYQILGLES